MVGGRRHLRRAGSRGVGRGGAGDALRPTAVLYLRYPNGHRCDSSQKIGFALDSPLEETGFELSVPPTRSVRERRPRLSPNSSVGRAIPLDRGAHVGSARPDSIARADTDALVRVRSTQV